MAPKRSPTSTASPAPPTRLLSSSPHSSSRYRDEIVASDYREGCAVAPIVIESTPASASLTDVTRRLFQDIIATMAARLEEKVVPPVHAKALATNAVTSMEGALVLSRALRSPEPFDFAIAMLTASAETAVTATA